MYKKGQSVIVVKPFEETRTPCPRKGTVGKVVSGERKDGFVRVAFATFIDANDEYEWGPNDEPFVLKFKPDEIMPNNGFAGDSKTRA